MSHSLNVILGSAIGQQVVFVGPFGVGKTTALRAVSDIPVVNTDVQSLEDNAGNPHKNTTTVGFDYGEWHFEGGERVALLGLPGQERFEEMWRILLRTSPAAVVLWLYGDRDPALRDCHFWLSTLAQHQAITRFAVAVTRTEHSGQPQTVDRQLDVYRERVAAFHPLAPVLAADPRNRSDVAQAIAMALATPYVPAAA